MLETQTTLEALRPERTHTRKVTDNVDADGDKAFDDYANAVCRTFYNTVYETFPREVRDMIYVHLYQKQELTVTVLYFESYMIPSIYSAPSHLWKSSDWSVNASRVLRALLPLQ